MLKRIIPILCVFVMVFSMMVPVAFAATVYLPDGIPQPPEYSSHTIVFSYKDTGGNIMAVYVPNSCVNKYSAEPVVLQSYGAYRVVINGTELFSWRFATYNSETEVWNITNRSTQQHSFEVSSSSDMYYSAIQLSLEDGTPFFPMPLWWIIQNLTQSHLQGEMIPQTQRTMLTLALFGVGCLALLMVLVILPKVLRRFLS